MYKILILAALMLTGCDYQVFSRAHTFHQDGIVCLRVFVLSGGIKCLPLTSENIKKMQALADELNGLEK